MKQLLISIDQLLNTAFLWWCGKAWADESISARAWRCRDRQPFKTLQPVIDRLFFDRRHCEKSFESELKRSQSPIEERQP